MKEGAQQVLADKEQIAEAIVKFVQKNNLRIHPGQEPLKWAELVIKKGGKCPCVKGRPECPCNFVLEDIKKLGRCRCGLFCNDGYIKQYERIRSQLKGSKRWSRKQKASS